MLTSAGVESSLPGLGLQPPWGPGLEELGGCSHLYSPALQMEYSCPQGADPTEEGLPMFHRRDSQAHQVPAKKGWSEQPAHPHLLLSLPCLDREGPRIRTGWASHMGSGRAPGLLRLTGQSWRPQPPGSRSRLQRSCPCSGPGPGPPATHPRSRRKGRWRRHGPPAGWEA